MTSKQAARLFLLILFTATLASCANHSELETTEYVMETTATDTLDFDPYKNYSTEHLLNQDEDLLVEYRDFDPTKLEQMLIEKAKSHSTLPTEYQEELRQLITHHQKEAESRKSYGKEQKILDLETKYNISVRPTSIDPDTITYLRLTLMFPQFYNFDRVYKSKVQKRCPFLHSVMPPVMRHTSFGGLIPGPDARVDRGSWGSMIWAHLYWLTCISDESMTIEKLAAQLLQRIEKSLLPNKLRFFILQRLNILTPQKYLHGGAYVAFENLPKMLSDAVPTIHWADPNNRNPY